MNFFHTRRARSLHAGLLMTCVLGVSAQHLTAQAESGIYLVVVNGDRAVDVVADHLESHGSDVRRELTGDIDIVVAHLDAGALSDIRNRPGIRWVEADS
ncbi:MAG: hypothetical protein ACKO3L_09975, partial [Actinomycetota bacterium]